MKQFLKQEIYMTSRLKLFAVDYDKRIWYERDMHTNEISEITIPDGASPRDRVINASRMNLIKLIDNNIEE